MEPKQKGQYDERDASDDTGVSEKEVKQAWHEARNDCQRSDNETDKSLSKDWSR
jgi:DNA-directed RNA polymerase specialized sigma24 family protein